MATNTSHLYAQFIFVHKNLEHFNQAIQNAKLRFCVATEVYRREWFSILLRMIIILNLERHCYS